MEPTQTRTHNKHHKHSVKATFEVQLYSPPAQPPSHSSAARNYHAEIRHISLTFSLFNTCCTPASLRSPPSHKYHNNDIIKLLTWFLCVWFCSEWRRASWGREREWLREGKVKGWGGEGRGSVGQSSSVLRLRGGRWGNMCSCLKEEVKKRWRVCVFVCVCVCVCGIQSHCSFCKWICLFTLTWTVALDGCLSFKVYLCENEHTHSDPSPSLHVCVCSCVCVPPLSIFAAHLLMTLNPTQGKGLQQGACVSSALAVRFMSAATATIPLIEEGIVDSTPQVTLPVSCRLARMIGC